MKDSEQAVVHLLQNALSLNPTVGFVDRLQQMFPKPVDPPRHDRWPLSYDNITGMYTMRVGSQWYRVKDEIFRQFIRSYGDPIRDAEMPPRMEPYRGQSFDRAWSDDAPRVQPQATAQPLTDEDLRTRTFRAYRY